MALATRLMGMRTAHLITGAPSAMWPSALCADIFNGGTFEPQEPCLRRFPRGSQRTAWDYLLEGGHDRYPERVPARIATRQVIEPIQLRGPGGSGELRAVRVEVDGDAPDRPVPRRVA